MEKEMKIEKKKREEGRLLYGIKRMPRLLFRRAASLITAVSEAFAETVWAEEKGEEKRFLRGAVFVGAFPAVLLFFAVTSLACFPMGARPVGFALLGALGGRGHLRIPFVGEKSASALETALLGCALCGILCSTAFLGGEGFFYLFGYVLLFSVRAWITGGKMDDSLLTRVTLSALFSCGVGLFIAFVIGLSAKSVIAGASMGILTPLMTYLLCGFYVFSSVTAENSLAESRRRVYLEATEFALFYLFLFSLREVRVLFLSLPVLLTVPAMFFVARHRGALYGAAVGLIGGMACPAPFSAPALAVGGFFAGLFFEYSLPVGVMVSFAAASGYSLYAEGLSSFASLTENYIWAAVFGYPILYLLPSAGIHRVKGAPREILHRETIRRTKHKLRRMSEAFSSLSEVFYTVSDTMKKPQLSESSRLISDCCSEICSRCVRSGVCWGEKRDYSAAATVTVASRLLEEGRISEEDFPRAFAEKCISLPNLARRINDRFSQMCGDYYKNNKTSLLAGEYSAVARLIRSTAGELDRELEYNPALEGRARRVLKQLGLSHRRVAIFGDRELRIDVYGVMLEKVTMASERIRRTFEEEFACRFEDPEFLMFEESVVLRMKRKRILALECAKSGCTKKGEVICGDSCLFFETEREYFYTLICDGMGSGREAAFTSRLSSIFIEKLMHCASPKNVTLDMLNTFLMAKTDETFTTVDLLEIDLYTAHANFIKAGAAPSYVLRRGALHKIESRTPPAGVLSRMCAEQTAFDLREGDFLILMSDGAEEGETRDGWLFSLLSGEEFSNAADLCERVFRTAREKADFRDDLSIAVIRIMNNK